MRTRPRGSPMSPSRTENRATLQCPSEGAGGRFAFLTNGASTDSRMLSFGGPLLLRCRVLAGMSLGREPDPDQSRTSNAERRSRIMDVKRSARAWVFVGALATCIAMALVTAGPRNASADDRTRTPGRLVAGDGPVSGDPDQPDDGSSRAAAPVLSARPALHDPRIRARRSSCGSAATCLVPVASPTILSIVRAMGIVFFLSRI